MILFNLLTHAHGQNCAYELQIAVRNLLALMLVFAQISRPNENVFSGSLKKYLRKLFWGEEEPSAKAKKLLTNNFKPKHAGSDDATTYGKECAAFLGIEISRCRSK